MNDNKINNNENNGVSCNVSTKVCSKCNRELSIDKFRYIHSKQSLKPRMCGVGNLF